MTEDIAKLSKERYMKMGGFTDEDFDDEGFIVLRPTAKRIDERDKSLTADISTLEDKLKQFKAEKTKIDKKKKTEDYKSSKKELSKKKIKKQQSSLLEMVFNTPPTDHEPDTDDEDGSGYIEPKKKRGRSASSRPTDKDGVYGKRFTPVVTLLHESITDFDRIAGELEDDLSKMSPRDRTMYKSSQTSNWISAKNSKLSAVKELASVVAKISDLEYKKDKDRQSVEGSDSSKALSNLAAKYLKGAYGDDAHTKPKNKDKGKSKYSKGGQIMRKQVEDDDDEDDDPRAYTARKQENDRNEQELAGEFAKALIKHKDDISFTAAEKYMAMEGKYTFIVLCDPLDPDNNWKFVAVDPSTGKEIRGFKEDYGDLFPKKKNCRMRFDLNRLKVTELNSSRTYKLILDE